MFVNEYLMINDKIFMIKRYEAFIGQILGYPFGTQKRGFLDFPPENAYNIIVLIWVYAIKPRGRNVIFRNVTVLSSRPKRSGGIYALR